MNESLSRALRLLRLSGMAETLEDFDWSSNTSIKRTEIFDLATCRFNQEVHDVLFVGPPGVGKSHLCPALGDSRALCSTRRRCLNHRQEPSP